MPYKNPDSRRVYDRLYSRKRRDKHDDAHGELPATTPEPARIYGPRGAVEQRRLIHLRLSAAVLDAIDAYATATNRTAFIHEAIMERLLKLGADVREIDLRARGLISSKEAARQLDVTIDRVIRIAHGIHIGEKVDGTWEFTSSDVEAMRPFAYWPTGIQRNPRKPRKPRKPHPNHDAAE